MPATTWRWWIAFALATSLTAIGGAAFASPDDGGGDAELTPEELAWIEEQEAAAEAEVIVVTGSVIERKELTTPAPVSVIDRADIDASGLTSVGDILQNLPAQANALNAQFNNTGSGETRVNLRGLGSFRTLVLINGRRVASGGDESVDLNAIPLAIVKRIEVLKDGASAIYGSEAIGGVVNIITRDDFEGVEANLNTGTSQRGDGQVYDASFLVGVNSDKANAVFGAGYSEQKPVWAGDRAFSNFDRFIDDWSICGKGDFGATADGPNFEAGRSCALVHGGSSATPGGRLLTDQDGDGMPDPGNAAWDSEVVENCPSGICTRDPVTGQWRDFNFGDEQGQNDFYNFQPVNYLYTPARKYHMFSTGHHDLSDDVQVFYEALYNHRFSRQHLAPEPLFLEFTGVAVSADNQFNPYGLDISAYRRRMTETGNRFFQQNVDSLRSVIGLKGDLPDDSPLDTWKWELSINYGRNAGVFDAHGGLIRSRLAAAVGPSYQDADGAWHCGTATDPGDEACSPLDLLGGSGSITPQQVAYLTYTGINSLVVHQTTVLAQAHGQLVKFRRGGDISAAVGVDHRTGYAEFTPDPLSATGDTTSEAIPSISGGYGISEAFVELSVVPIVGTPALQWVELGGAARAFADDQFGSGITWKAAGLIRTVGGISFRGTYSTAFRAPSYLDLYSGQQELFVEASDPCDTGPTGSDGPLPPGPVRDQCIADGLDPDNFQNADTELRVLAGSNPDLSPETAHTLTAGIVFEPPSLKGLAITLDYFGIVLEGEVGSEGVAAILQNCYQRGVQEECARIRRSGSGVIDLVDDTLINVGSKDTSGIDFAIAYEHAVGDAGTIAHQLEGTYLLAFHQATGFVDPATDAPVILNGRGVYDLGVYPYLKANYATRWARGPAGAGVNVRYIGGYSECELNDCNSGTQLRRHVDSNVTADLWGSYRVKTAAGTTTLSLGVNNVLDQDPPFLDNGFLADSDAATYDFLGRYFYVRMNQAL